MDSSIFYNVRIRKLDGLTIDFLGKLVSDLIYLYFLSRLSQRSGPWWFLHSDLKKFEVGFVLRGSISPAAGFIYIYLTYESALVSKFSKFMSIKSFRSVTLALYELFVYVALDFQAHACKSLVSCLQILNSCSTFSS